MARIPSGGVPIAGDAAIAKRLADLQAEAVRLIAGCHCPRDRLGHVTHTVLCLLRPAPVPAMAAAREPMQRARERLNRTPPPAVPERRIEAHAPRAVLTTAPSMAVPPPPHSGRNATTRRWR